jgi:hypothetical protein
VERSSTIAKGSEIELYVGEESRTSPAAVDLRQWIASGIPSSVVEAGAQFPVTFDRSVWPNQDDLKVGPIPITSPETNILDLTPMGMCKGGRPWDGSSACRLSISLTTFRGSLTRAVREGCEVNAIKHRTEKPPGWISVGYDVLDSGLATSGLLNCGPAAQDAAWELLRRHKRMLNRYVLWPSPDIAKEYALQLDKLISDHGPFEVVGLHICALP